MPLLLLVRRHAERPFRLAVIRLQVVIRHRPVDADAVDRLEPEVVRHHARTRPQPMEAGPSKTAQVSRAKRQRAVFHLVAGDDRHSLAQVLNVLAVGARRIRIRKVRRVRLLDDRGPIGIDVRQPAVGTDRPDARPASRMSTRLPRSLSTLAMFTPTGPAPDDDGVIAAVRHGHDRILARSWRQRPRPVARHLRGLRMRADRVPDEPLRVGFRGNERGLVGRARAVPVAPVGGQLLPLPEVPQDDQVARHRPERRIGEHLVAQHLVERRRIALRSVGDLMPHREQTAGHLIANGVEHERQIGVHHPRPPQDGIVVAGDGDRELEKTLACLVGRCTRDSARVHGDRDTAA